MPPRRPTDLLADLKDAFPRQRVELATITVYVRELADVPIDDLERAVRGIIRESQWFPTVSEIRARVAEMTLELPIETAALAQVDARMEWARQEEDGRGEPPPIHPLVSTAVDRVGGWHSFRTEDASAVGGRFGRVYRELRAAAIREKQIGELG